MTNAPAALAALRIARRDAWRHKARSSLVVLMIAVPVLGLTSADVLARTYQLSTTDKLDRTIGQADASITLFGGGPIKQGTGIGGATEDLSGTGLPHTRSGPPGSAAYRALQARALGELPAGSRAVDYFVRDGGDVRADGRSVKATLISLNLADPITRGITQPHAGRAPRDTTGVEVTTALASRLGLHIGSSLTVGADTRTVTGIVIDPSNLKDDEVYGILGSLPIHNASGSELIASTAPVTWPNVLRLNQIAIGVTSRSVVTHPPAGVQDVGGTPEGEDAQTIGLATVAVGLAVLEVVLLAGAAFAVGARRARRDLALVSATGGQPRDIRNVVLAGGLVLGTTGAVIGVVGGVATARGLIPVLNHFAHHAPGSFDVRPLELLAVVVLGIVTGLLASILPARSAGKVDVVAALTGRRGVVTSARRVPIIGLSGVVVGALIAGYGAHPPVRFTAILVGAVVSELGFVMCAPAFVGLAGRLARWAPLSPRLALRDAARHRGRSGPAVAAIMAAIAGSIAVSTYFVSQESTDRATYFPQAPIGQTLIRPFSPHAGASPKFQAALTAVLPGLGAKAAQPVPVLGCSHGRHCGTTPQIVGLELSPNSTFDVAVADQDLLAHLTGRQDSGAAAALAAGDVVALASGRSADLAVGAPGGHPTLQGVGRAGSRLPVYVEGVARAGSLVGAVISPSTAQALGLRTQTSQYLVTTTSPPTQAQEDAAQATLDATHASIYVERGYVSPGITAGLLVLLAVSAIVTLGATGITTGLSVAESRPDLTTLSAVGAAPLTRRLVVASQSATVALLGAVLGVLSGLIPAWAVVQGRTGMSFAMPWETIGLSIAAIPLLAVLLTSAFVRTPSTLVRRAS
jgi:putative ABC transport system permease protein